MPAKDSEPTNQIRGAQIRRTIVEIAVKRRKGGMCERLLPVRFHVFAGEIAGVFIANRLTCRSICADG
jgi:hypothetical protein